MKIVQKIVNGISIVIIVVAILALLTVVMTPKGEVPNFLGFSLFRVTTGSMEPAIPTNSMIVVKRVGVDQVKEGDIISFFSNDPSLGGAVNTHRIMEIDRSSGKVIIITKGDANVIKDEYPVYEKDLIGVVVGQSKAFGIIQRLASNPLIFLPFIVLPLVIMLISNLVKTIRTARSLADQEEEAALKEALELLEQNEQLKKKKAEETQKALEEAQAEVDSLKIQETEIK